jgi:hypothetical protein
MGWRLAFDSWQRQARGDDAYLPTPSRPYSVLRGGFTAFIADLCRHHQIPPPARADEAYWLTRGQQRWQQVQRLQLLRHLFRRALELWLVCDRALYLREQHYDVTLATFCPRAWTPRNLILHAHHHGD